MDRLQLVLCEEALQRTLSHYTSGFVLFQLQVASFSMKFDVSLGREPCKSLLLYLNYDSLSGQEEPWFRLLCD